MELWDRQRGESDKAYEAFRIYLTMEARSISKVAQQCTKCQSLLKRWAAKYHWRERADAWDESVIEAERQAKIDARKRNLTRQEEFAQLLISKASEILAKANTNRGSFYAATQMGELGFRLLNDVETARTKADNTNSQILIKLVKAGEGDD